MIDKMSLEQFRSIKSRIMEIISMDSTGDIDEQALIAEYHGLIKELLSHDLSDIPFEEWKGIGIWTEEPLDFSLTRANLDFSLFEALEAPSFNLRNCNIRGLDYIKYDKSSFDDDFVATHPEYFVPDDIPDDVKDRFYKHQLTFGDLYKYPALRPIVTERRIAEKSFYSTQSSNLINKIGYENAMRLFDENPKLLYLLTYDKKSDDDFDNESQVFFTSGEVDKNDYDSVKRYIFGLVITYCNMHPGKHRFIDYGIFEQMKDVYPQYFIPRGTIPDEDLEKFYMGTATIFLLVRYKDVLKNIDLDFVTRRDYVCSQIRLIFGNISSFLDNVPLEILFEVSDFVGKQSFVLEKEENVTYDDVIKRSLLRNKDEIGSLAVLYTYSKYVPLHLLCEPELKLFIEKFGFGKLIEFNTLHNGLLEKNDKGVYKISNSVLSFFAKEFGKSEFSRTEDDYTNISDERLYAMFSILVENARKEKKIPSMISNSIKEAFPQEFIDYGLARELLKDYTPEQQKLIITELERKIDSDGELLQFINRYPMLIDVIKKLDYSFTPPYFMVLKEKVGKEKLLEVSTKYGEFIYTVFKNNTSKPEVLNRIIDLINNSDDFENQMNEFVYSFINDENVVQFDIRLIPKSFRDNHPELFLRDDADEKLKEIYYSLGGHESYCTLDLAPKLLYEHEEWIKEVRHLDFSKSLSRITITTHMGGEYFESANLFKALGKKFTNDEILDFISIYGSFVNQKVLKDLMLDTSLSKEEQMNKIINRIYYSLSNDRVDYNETNLPREFREAHSELFLEDNAPEELKNKFYAKEIGLDELKAHPEWKEYLKGKNFYACCSSLLSELVRKSLKYDISYEEIIDFIVKYDKYFDSKYIKLDNVPADSKTDSETFIKELIIKSLRNRVGYDDEIAYDLFHEDAPDLFLDKSAPVELRNLFYNAGITCEHLKNNPEWINILNGKNLHVCVSSESLDIVDAFFNCGMNEQQVMALMAKYGRYLTKDYINHNNINNEWLNDIETHIKESIINAIVNEHKAYDEDAKGLIGHLRADLFLDDDAPEDLKDSYYGRENKEGLNFTLLKNNRKRWLPYLKNKELANVLSKGTPDFNRTKWVNFFAKYGEEKALDMGMKNPDAIKWAIETDHLDVYDAWYNRLSFVPHKVVLMDFPVDRIDDFAASGKLWSQLMKIERHNINDDLKSSMLKASMCFGVFNGDDEGFTKLMQLYTDIPKTLSSSEMKVIREYLSNNSIEDPSKKEENDKIIKFLEKAYYLAGDKYKIRIKQQDNKEDVKKLRIAMEDAKIPRVLTPKNSHDLFGAFGMIYEPEFRDFLINNIEELLTNKKDLIPYMGLVQKKWNEIKVLNSNRVLTLSLALNYVKNNRYTGVHVGNKHLEKTIGEQGFPQEDFNTLQKIYNFGKLRVASSIPRVEGYYDNYQYEITRLDDPIPCVIGKRSGCCQELGNHAEVCMEHSMVSEDGRLFVIKDEEGNIVAQSWVWRNGNVICFDNIEIPNNAFERANDFGKSNQRLAQEIFNLYKKVAEDLMRIDEQKYKQLLLNGSITEEQYEQLVLAKVTVGLGNNDIKAAIELYSPKDTDVRYVLPFDPPVKLTREMYTSDSLTQHLLAGKSEVPKTVENNIFVYTDDYVILDDYNIEEVDVHALELLENYCKRKEYFGYVDLETEKHIVSKVASYYGLNSSNPKVIRHANFAIIYEETDDKIKIGEILFTDKVLLNEEEKDVTDIVRNQIALAFKQINPNNKEYDVSLLEGNAKEMFDSVFGISPQEKEGEKSYGNK